MIELYTSQCFFRRSLEGMGVSKSPVTEITGGNARLSQITE